MQKQVTFNKVNILGGDSIFTIQSIKTGVSYSYMIKKVAKERSDKPASKFTNTYSIKVSTDGERYYYAGCLRNDTLIDSYKFITNQDSYFNEDSNCIKALLWVLGHIGTDKVIFYNHYRCSVCNNLIEGDKEVSLGYHEQCYKLGETIVNSYKYM